AEAKNIETLESDLRRKSWRRYSQRKNCSMEIGGICGEVGYQGNLYGFLPYLFLGHELHVGKATSFGLGMMEVEIF
ncbi:MAG: CRISPR system precrRNA processing endoribonuclease RAMP protein Cas6, partial [Deltaproteobacteria bacterium]|nr:CRISPR system precrRNA processing endoribonuclease RAMP protein Cas6 [Deltaproteobacteria bacterium]